MAKGDLSFEPQTDTLKPFFAEGSGINSDAKAFAFVLGALFGKLIQVQSSKGVNVNSNALTWLKRLEISGKDLPELYTKIRGKFLAYNFKKNQSFLNLEKDLGYLGAKLGDEIELNKTVTCYFLLLGQSLTTRIFPKKETTETNQTEETLL
jgi:CRISPR-associated protein Csh1